MPHISGESQVAITANSSSQDSPKNSQSKFKVAPSPLKFVEIPNFPACLHGEWSVISREPYLHAIMRFPQGLDLPPHHYPTAATIKVISGNVHYEDFTLGQTYQITAGQGLNIPEHRVHEMRFVEDTALECVWKSNEFNIYWDFEER